MSENKSRRDFMKQASVAVALTALGQPTPAQTKARYIHSPGRVIGANDRINIGFVGCGGRMNTHIDYFAKRAKESGDAQPVAVCDIYEKRKRSARERAGVDEKSVYHDYRDLCARK